MDIPALEPDAAREIESAQIRFLAGIDQVRLRKRQAGCDEQTRQAVSMGIERRLWAIDDSDAFLFPGREIFESRSSLAH